MLPTESFSVRCILDWGKARLMNTPFRLVVLTVMLTALSFAGSSRAADALNPGDLDPTFLIGSGADQSIETLAIHPTNGVMYIGGRFIDYN